MTGENNTKAPENQDKPEDTKLAGKFDKVEDLINSYKELEKKFTELSEKYDKQERLLELLQDDSGGTSEPAPTYEPIEGVDGVEPDALLPEGTEWLKNVLDMYQNRLKTEMKREVYTALTMQEQRRKAEEKFYAENPDLRGHEDLVDFEAAKLLQELGGKPPKNPEKFAKVVAAKVRERIAKIKTMNNPNASIPRVEGSSSKAPERDVHVPEPEVSEEELYDEYLEQRNKLVEMKRV